MNTRAEAIFAAPLHLRANLVLLAGMVLVSAGHTLLAPFLIVGLRDYLALRVSEVGACLFWGAVVGQAASYAVSALIDDESMDTRCVLSVAVMSLAPLIFLLARQSPARIAIVFIGVLTDQVSTGIYGVCYRSLYFGRAELGASKEEMLSYMTTARNLGTILGPWIGALLIERIGFSGVLAGNAAAYVLAAVVFFAGSRGGVRGEEHAPVSRSLWDLLGVSRDELVLAVSVIAFFILLAQAYVVPIAFQSNFRNANEVTSLFFSLNAISAITLSVPVVVLMRRYVRGDRWRLAAGAVTGVAGVILLNVCRQMWGFVAGTVLITLAEIIGPALLNARMIEDSETPNRSMAFYSLVSSAVGLGVGQWIGTIVPPHSAAGPWIWSGIGSISLIAFVAAGRREPLGSAV